MSATPAHTSGVTALPDNAALWTLFTKGAVVGYGVSSTVYAVQSRSSGEWFALKTARLETVEDSTPPSQSLPASAAAASSSSSEQTKNVLNEINMLRVLRHRNVVRLHHVFATPTAVHMLMELGTHGCAIDLLMSQYPSGLPERLAAAVFADVLRALAYLHRQGVVHGDVKPENVLLTSSDHGSGPRVRALLADFGFSRRIRPGEQLQQRAGTPQYVAPEVLLGDGHGVESDLWSAGVLLYVLLSGRMPFFGNDDAEMFDRILHVRFHFHSPFFDHVSPDAKDMVAQLLQRAPVDRPTAAAAAEHPWLRQLRCGSNGDGGRLEQGSGLLVSVPNMTPPRPVETAIRSGM